MRYYDCGWQHKAPKKASGINVSNISRFPGKNELDFKVLKPPVLSHLTNAFQMQTI